jgi:hypothetical protein
MQSFELELLSMRAEHSQKVKATPIVSDYKSKDCINSLPSIAVSRLKEILPVNSLTTPNTKLFFPHHGDSFEVVVNLEGENIDTMIKECFKKDNPSLALNYFNTLIAIDKIKPDATIYCLVINYLCKKNEVAEVLKIVNEISIPITAAFLVTLIYGLAIDAKDPKLAISFFTLVEKHNIKPNIDLYQAMLDAWMEIDAEKAKIFFKKKKLAIFYKKNFIDCRKLSNGWSFVQILAHIDANKNTSKDFIVCLGKKLQSNDNEFYKKCDYILEKAKIYRDYFINYRITFQKYPGHINFKFKLESAKTDANESKEHFGRLLYKKTSSKKFLQKNPKLINSSHEHKNNFPINKWDKTTRKSLRNDSFRENLLLLRYEK